jgi:hypothetical protein
MMFWVRAADAPVDAVVALPVESVTTNRARRQASWKAHRKIADPVILRERQAAEDIRKMVAAMQLQLIRAARLQGRSPMCFDDRYEPCQFD